VDTHTHTHTHTGPFALFVPLKRSVNTALSSVLCNSNIRILKTVCCVFCLVDLFHFFAIVQKFGGYDKVIAIPYIGFDVVVFISICCVIVLLCKDNN